MTFNLFLTLYNEALEQPNLDRYILERGWQEWMNNYSADKISAILKKIYSLANADNKCKAVFNEFHNLKEISETFGIPYRTVQNWNSGQADPTDYLIMLIAYAVINDIIEEKTDET